MNGKFLVSYLPLLMKDNGIKNVTELSLKTGIQPSVLNKFLKEPHLDLELINQLTDFFKCRQNGLITLEEKYQDYANRLKNDPKYNGIVYFLKASNGLTKIGWTGNLKQRKEQLEQTEKTKTELVHYISTFDCLTLEKTIHKLFANKRVKGEWFDLNDEDINLFK